MEQLEPMILSGKMRRKKKKINPHKMKLKKKMMSFQMKLTAKNHKKVNPYPRKRDVAKKFP
jgi:hypothetical protein